MSSTEPPLRLTHNRWGLCDLLRIEGTDWVVRFLESGKVYVFPSEARTQFARVTTTVNGQTARTTAVGGATPGVSTESTRKTTDAQDLGSGKAKKKETIALGGLDSQSAKELLPRQALPSAKPPTRSKPMVEISSRPSDLRRARRAIESLRIGLPVLHSGTRQFAVGFHRIESTIQDFLKQTADGGDVLVIKGAYGQGKTFGLNALEDIALERGYAAARVEIDATENRLDKPPAVYRSLMRTLRFPGDADVGARSFAIKVNSLLTSRTPGASSGDRFRWLDDRIQCQALSWLFADHRVTDKPELMSLLVGEPIHSIWRCRQANEYLHNNSTHWPSFRNGTQGDFACYLIGGIARSARLLGCNGLILILDEMEKWQDLGWHEQSRASNLVGGLIWNATAPAGRRGRDQTPPGLKHSGSRGYPFATPERTHLGIAIAMTPRSESVDPIELWRQYGPLRIAQLDDLTQARLIEYVEHVAADYMTAYGLCTPQPNDLQSIGQEVTRIWKQQRPMNMRTGVQSAIAALDHWRDRHDSTA